MRNCKFTSFDHLPKLPNLESIDAHNNKIVSIEGLWKLDKLTTFNIEHEKLTSFDEYSEFLYKLKFQKIIFEPTR